MLYRMVQSQELRWVDSARIWTRTEQDPPRGNNWQQGETAQKQVLATDYAVGTETQRLQDKATTLRN